MARQSAVRTFLGTHPRAAAERQQEDRERHRSHGGKRTDDRRRAFESLASPVMSREPAAEAPLSGAADLGRAQAGQCSPAGLSRSKLSGTGWEKPRETTMTLKIASSAVAAAALPGSPGLAGTSRGADHTLRRCRSCRPRSGRPPPEEHGPGQVVRPGRPPAARAATGAAVPMARDRPAVISGFCEANL